MKVLKVYDYGKRSSTKRYAVITAYLGGGGAEGFLLAPDGTITPTSWAKLPMYEPGRRAVKWRDIPPFWRERITSYKRLVA